MLDLDSLAEKRAKVLNEKEEPWRKAVWSPGFQKISASMSDGEVEILLASCKSFAQVEAVVVYLGTLPENVSPYSLLVQEAASAGVGLGDWISRLPLKV